MQDRYIADEAKVNISSLEAETVMKSTPVSTVKSILGRIGIEYEEGLPKEAYIAAFKEEFSDGQIAGVLRRLRTTGRLVSPKRGYYENTKSSNVLAELVKDISNLIQKYNTSVPITVFNGLNAADRKKYTETLDKLMACQKSIES